MFKASKRSVLIKTISSTFGERAVSAHRYKKVSITNIDIVGIAVNRITDRSP